MRKLRFLAFALVISVLPMSASAEDVNSIFAKMDKVTNGYDDLMMSIHMTVIDVDGSKKTYDYDLFQKGEKRLIKFNSGEMKGMATLVRSPSEVYAYLPAQRKIRRVAAHKMGQSLAGSDMTNDDMAFASWTAAYTPALESEDGKVWVVRASAKGVAPYPQALITITKDGYQPIEYKFLNDKGEVVKIFSNTNLKDWGGYIRAEKVTVTTVATGHKTTLDLKAFKVNQGYDDDMFSKRELEWGR